MYLRRGSSKASFAVTSQLHLCHIFPNSNLSLAYLHEYHDSQYGIAHGEDTPEDTHCFGAPHVLGGVVVTTLMVVYITLHSNTGLGFPL